MKKLFSLLAVALLSTTILSAQSFKSGDNVASATVGFGGGYGIPISLSYEIGVKDFNETMSLGAGAVLGYGSSSEDIASLGKWKYSNFLIGAMCNFHYTAVENLDLYGGVILGYDAASAKWSGTGAKPDAVSAGGLMYGLNVGARYYLSDNFALAANVGYGLSYLSVGVAYKF